MFCNIFEQSSCKSKNPSQRSFDNKFYQQTTKYVRRNVKGIIDIISVSQKYTFITVNVLLYFYKS